MTRRKDHWPDDPVVREVREARAKLWKEGGGTIEGFIAVVHRRAAELLPKKKTRRRRAR